MRKRYHFINIVALFILLFVTSRISLYAQEKPDALQEYRNGRYDTAIEICKAEIQQNPANLESYVVMSWSLVKLARYDEALVYAKKGLELNRYDVRIIEILGEIAYYQGRNNEAIRLFQQYITFAPEGSRIDVVYYFLGELYIRLGRYRHADIALSTAVRFVSGNALWWNRLGFARENAGEIRNAMTAYEKALSLNPNLADAQRGLERCRQSLAGR
ncbi:tetratricopeptide repeat protein [Gracilinema caldarium]|uniref:tetratricopeptide repeat protein n=1 Tax=Gracilinema caldarium TaxID=215591 RepID=UPI0026EEAAC8|nr:tetratricopeptide repeat protein [Gracilinema caldarium]